MFLEKRGCPRTALEFCKLILRWVSPLRAVDVPVSMKLHTGPNLAGTETLEMFTAPTLSEGLFLLLTGAAPEASLEHLLLLVLQLWREVMAEEEFWPLVFNY